MTNLYIYYNFCQNFLPTNMNELIKDALKVFINNNNTSIFIFFVFCIFTLALTAISASILALIINFTKKLYQQLIIIYITIVKLLEQNQNARF